MDDLKKRRHDDLTRARSDFSAACLEMKEIAERVQLNDIKGYRELVELLLRLRNLGDILVFEMSDQSDFPARGEIYKLWDGYRCRKDKPCLHDM